MPERSPQGPNGAQPRHGAELSVAEDGDHEALIVTVAGEIDLASASSLEECLTAAIDQAPRVVADLGGVTFLDSTGLSVLVRAVQRAEARQGELRVRRPPEQVRHLLEMTGIDQILPVDDS